MNEINYLKTWIINELKRLEKTIKKSSGGGTIESIKINGTELPVVDKSVDIPASSTNQTGVLTSDDYTRFDNISSSVETVVDNAISDHNTSSQSHQDIRTSISTINGKIPEQASTSNQLADKNFVNSSVATNTSYFLATLDIIEDLHLTYDATMLQVITALNSYSFASVKTNNDYCNVITQDNIGNTVFERFKWNSQESTFKYEFSLNNSSFTAVQWASINSNATAENIAQIALNALAITSLQSDVAGKVSKAGDTMTGRLLNNHSIALSDWNGQDTRYHWGFRQDSTQMAIRRWNADLTDSTYVLNFNTSNNAFFRGTIFNKNQSTYELVNSNEAQQLIDSTVANYLPLTGGEITGDITFQGQPNTQQYIKFFKDSTSLNCFAIRNPYGGGQIDIGLYSRSTNDYTPKIVITNNSLVVDNNLKVYEISSTAANKYQTKTEVDQSLQNYLPLAGGTMTGDLNIDNSAGVVLFPSGSENYRGRIKAMGAYYGFQSSANGGSSWADSLKLYVAQDKAIFQRNNIYTGQTEDEDHRLQDGADVDNKLANYLPLVSDTQKTIVTTPPDGIVFRRNSSNGGMFIDFYSNNSTSIGWRFGSERDNNFYLGYTTNGMTSDSPKSRLYTNGDLCISGNVYANGTSIAIAKKLATTEEINTPTISTSATLVGGITHLNVLGSIDYATITLPTNSGTAEYNGTFTSTTSGDITVSLPLTFWDGDTDIVAGKSYSFSIQNGVGFIIQLD